MLGGGFMLWRLSLLEVRQTINCVSLVSLEATCC
jgi:hypothetical protein